MKLAQTIRAKSRWTAALFFSSIHPFTVLTLIFCLFSSGIVTPNPCIQMQFPLPTLCFNVALNSGVRASTIWINIENGEQGKSLVITPQWSNTFGPDCRLHGSFDVFSGRWVIDIMPKSKSIDVQVYWCTCTCLIGLKLGSGLAWNIFSVISWGQWGCSKFLFSNLTFLLLHLLVTYLHNYNHYHEEKNCF